MSILPPLIATPGAEKPTAFVEALVAQRAVIEAWFEAEWRDAVPPFYCSVDVRHAGYRMTPVDTNLFSAGFNNLSAPMLPYASRAVRAMLEEHCGGANELLLVPESHTRNVFYLESLANLVDIIREAGVTVRLASLIEDLNETQPLTLASGRVLELEPLVRQGDRVGVADFFPDYILLNNDFSSHIPDVFKNLAQQVMPSLQLTWASRLKSTHFRRYAAVVAEFAGVLNMDPWLFAPIFRNCGKLDFMKREGEQCLARNAQLVVNAVQQKYAMHGIDEKPFVVVKADAGTYGMSVMMVHDPESLRALSRKQRTRMAKSKGGQAVSKVIIQEGVPTIDYVEGSIAEPVIYMMGNRVVGGFYRVHPERGPSDNLNAQGMTFTPMVFDASADDPVFYSYTVVARLALLAASKELMLLGDGV